jgi:hypothetical protein
VLSPYDAPGAIILSDLPLEIMETSSLPSPEGVREGRYFVYRR